MHHAIAYTLALAAALTQGALALTPSQTGNCTSTKGYVVYFDFSKCDNKKDLTPYAVKDTEAGIREWGPIGGQAPTTVCITDDQFQGSLFVSNTSSMGRQQFVYVMFDAPDNSTDVTGQAYVESHPDDQPGKVGTKPASPILTELTSFAFADNPDKVLTGKSPATKVLQTHKPHVAMYINYCGSPGIGPKTDSTTKDTTTKPDTTKPTTTKPDSNTPDSTKPDSVNGTTKSTDKTTDKTTDKDKKPDSKQPPRLARFRR